MKNVLTLVLALTSALAMAQWPTLPYNPDENGDGLIGVADLAALLANYNTEFSGAVVAENGESAIVYMGPMTFPGCKYSCDQLPGFWSLPEIEDLVPVWSQVYSTNSVLQTWLDTPENENYPTVFWSSNGSGPNYQQISTSWFLSSNECYCTAKQLPRVEYYLAYGQPGNVSNDVQEKLANGWFPLGLTMGDSGDEFGQTLWRWAE